MPILDAFPRVQQVLDGDGPVRQAIDIPDAGGEVQILDHGSMDELACDVSTLTGGHACLHNEHVDILQSLDTVTQNQAEIAARQQALQQQLDQIEGKIDDLLGGQSQTHDFLNAIFEGAP